MGSDATVSSGMRGPVPMIFASQLPPRRRRSAGTVGVVGAPSRTQPYSTAVSAHKGQTST